MRIVMMGTGTFAEPIFSALLNSSHQIAGLVTQPDRAAGHERGSTRQTGPGMKGLALARGLPVLQPESINTPEGIAALKELRPELLVVAAYGQILAKDVLEAAPLGGINVHASLLPKYRGAAPVAWAIYHGETRAGVTIIRMSTALDAGDMLAQEAIDILPDETAGELETRLAALGARMALDVLGRMMLGPVTGIKQDKSLVTKAPKLKKENGLLDWTRSATAVCNQVRAMQPWPTAYTFWRREGQAPLRLLILRAHPAAVAVESGTPGDLLTREPKRLLVHAGDATVVEVLELQPAGKKRMSAEEFLRGRPVKPGDRLGGE